MTAIPMRPVENVLALVAACCVGGALLPWDHRAACALAAIACAALLVVLRWRAHTYKVQKRRIVDVYSQVARLRAERKARFERRPRRP